MSIKIIYPGEKLRQADERARRASLSILFKLKDVQRMVGGKIRWSRRDVSHLVLEDTSCSVCWFGRSRRYRLFWPYPADVQNRYTSESLFLLVEKVFAFMGVGGCGE